MSFNPNRVRADAEECDAQLSGFDQSAVVESLCMHIPGCMMWHSQGGDYDRDCPACMDLAAVEQGKTL